MSHTSICDTPIAVPTATLGGIRTGEGEIILVYVEDGERESDSVVVRYDELPRKCRSRVRWIAEDPLKVLGRQIAPAG